MYAYIMLAYFDEKQADRKQKIKFPAITNAESLTEDLPKERFKKGNKKIGEKVLEAGKSQHVYLNSRAFCPPIPESGIIEPIVTDLKR